MDQFLSHKFLSGRINKQSIGIPGNTDNTTVLDTAGNVGIGTTDTEGHRLLVSGISTFVGDVSVLGILSATSLYSTVYGEFKGGTVSGDLLVGTGLSVSGIGTIGTLGVSGLTTTKDLNITELTTTKDLNVAGVSTFVGLSTFSGDVIFQGAAAGQNMTWDASENDLEFTDAARLKFGNSDDLEIWHGGPNSHIKNSTNELRIRSDSILLKRADDSEAYLEATVNSDVKLYYNGDEKFATTVEGIDVTGRTETDLLNVSGISTFNDSVRFLDDKKLHFGNIGGTFGDLQIWHDAGQHSYIRDQGSGDLRIYGSGVDIRDSAGTSSIARFTDDGVAVTGNLNASGISTFGAAVDINSTLDVSGEVFVASNIKHTGDTDTYIAFTDDQIELYAGGKGILTVQEATVDTVIVNDGGNNCDFRVEGLNDENLIFSDGGNDSVGIGTSIPTAKLDVAGDFKIAGVSTFVGLVTVTTGDVHIAQRLFVGGLEVEGTGSENTFTGINTFTNLQDNVLGNTNTGSLQGNGGFGIDKSASFGDKVWVQNAVGIGSTIPTGALDVVGHTELDNLNVSGILTAASYFGDGGGLTDVNVPGINTEGQTSFTDLDLAGNLSVAGVSTFADQAIFTSNTQPQIEISPTSSTIDGMIHYTGDKTFSIWGGTTSDNRIEIHGHQNSLNILCEGQGETELYHNGSLKFTTVGTGVSIANGISTSATLFGPENIIIDPNPIGVGATSGNVRIRGNLYVEGTEFVVDSELIQLGDFVVGIATTVTSDLLTDGAGIGIGSIGHEKTFKYEYNSGTNPSLKSSENLNVATGKGYQVAETSVLNATTLGSGVVNSSLTSLGTIVTGAWQGTAIADAYVASAATWNAKIANVVEDTTPQLGGDLDLNDKLINGTGGVNITGVITATDFVGSGINTSGTSTFNNVHVLNHIHTNTLNAVGIITADGFVGGGINTAGGSVFSDLKVTGISTFGGLIDANGDVQIGAAVTVYSATGIVSATEFWGDGFNLENLIGTKIGGLTLREEGTPVGSGVSAITDINIAGDNLTATGVGAAATITLTEDPSFDSLTVTSLTGAGCIVYNTGSGLLDDHANLSYTAGTATLNVVNINCTGYADLDDVNVSGIVTATDFNSTSDAKLKTNIKQIEDPLDKIVQIGGVSFNWIEDNRPSLGVIADELEKVLPELVSDSDPKTVNYNGLIGLLIEAVKEQQIQINDLESRLSNLE